MVLVVGRSRGLGGLVATRMMAAAPSMVAARSRACGVAMNVSTQRSASA